MELLEPYILKDMLGGLAAEVGVVVIGSPISTGVAARLSANSRLVVMHAILSKFIPIIRFTWILSQAADW